MCVCVKCRDMDMKKTYVEMCWTSSEAKSSLLANLDFAHNHPNRVLINSEKHRNLSDGVGKSQHSTLGISKTPRKFNACLWNHQFL